MPRRPLRELPDHIFPADEWRLVETRFSNRWVDRTETVFALANGYLGLRGGFDEGRPAASPGTFVAGFHEDWQIVYPEEAYGLARVGQTIVNAPDATILKLDVDDEPLFVPVARLRSYARGRPERGAAVARPWQRLSIDLAVRRQRYCVNDNETRGHHPHRQLCR